MEKRKGTDKWIGAWRRGGGVWRMRQGWRGMGRVGRDLAQGEGEREGGGRERSNMKGGRQSGKICDEK